MAYWASPGQVQAANPVDAANPDVIAYIDSSLAVESYLIDEAGHDNAVALLGRPDIGVAATLDIVLTHGIQAMGAWHLATAGIVILLVAAGYPAALRLRPRLRRRPKIRR